MSNRLMTPAYGENDQEAGNARMVTATPRVIVVVRELAANPQGPLYRNLVIGYSMFAIGLVIGIGSAIALKFTN